MMNAFSLYLSKNNSFGKKLILICFTVSECKRRCGCNSMFNSHDDGFLPTIYPIVSTLTFLLLNYFSESPKYINQQKP